MEHIQEKEGGWWLGRTTPTLRVASGGIPGLPGCTELSRRCPASSLKIRYLIIDSASVPCSAVLAFTSTADIDGRTIGIPLAARTAN